MKRLVMLLALMAGAMPLQAQTPIAINPQVGPNFGFLTATRSWRSRISPSRAAPRWVGRLAPPCASAAALISSRLR